LVQEQAQQELQAHKVLKVFKAQQEQPVLLEPLVLQALELPVQPVLLVQLAQLEQPEPLVLMEQTEQLVQQVLKELQ
jgi:hypothetical protein